jgi:hypothetical protein
MRREEPLRAFEPRVAGLHEDARKRADVERLDLGDGGKAPDELAHHAELDQALDCYRWTRHLRPRGSALPLAEADSLGGLRAPANDVVEPFERPGEDEEDVGLEESVWVDADPGTCSLWESSKS